jgi:lysozyme
MVETPMMEQARAAGKVTAAAAAIAAASLLAMPGIRQWEGLRTMPYLDIVGVPTVCYGETRVPMRRYAVAECEAMALATLQKDFGPAVVRCVPGLGTAARLHQLAASLLLAYNIGARAFCGSTAARLFNAGRWRDGCTAFLKWNRAGGRVVQGLINRRQHEVAICRQGL